MNKIVIGFALIIIATLTLTSCSKKNKIKFDDEIAPYTKKKLMSLVIKSIVTQ